MVRRLLLPRDCSHAMTAKVHDSAAWRYLTALAVGNALTSAVYGGTAGSPALTGSAYARVGLSVTAQNSLQGRPLHRYIPAGSDSRPAERRPASADLGRV